MGAWIETFFRECQGFHRVGRSLMGAWIETSTDSVFAEFRAVAPLWERGLKQ